MQAIPSNTPITSLCFSVEFTYFAFEQCSVISLLAWKNADTLTDADAI